MPIVVGLHYVTAFALELVMLFGFGACGYRVAQGGLVGGLLAALLVGIAIALWANFVAPSAARRLPAVPLVAFKAAIFLAGAVAIWLAGWREAALVFGVVAALDLGVAMALGRV
ncbi:MAG: YrdB family protein [Alphaproteobacteria bacterium]|nr:YrdB family protein [Alphaproteobacteria bacterium]